MRASTNGRAAPAPSEGEILGRVRKLVDRRAALQAELEQLDQRRTIIVDDLRGVEATVTAVEAAMSGGPVSAPKTTASSKAAASPAAEPTNAQRLARWVLDRPGRFTTGDAATGTGLSKERVSVLLSEGSRAGIHIDPSRPEKLTRVVTRVAFGKYERHEELKRAMSAITPSAAR